MTIIRSFSWLQRNLYHLVYWINCWIPLKRGWPIYDTEYPNLYPNCSISLFFLFYLFFMKTQYNYLITALKRTLCCAIDPPTAIKNKFISEEATKFYFINYFCCSYLEIKFSFRGGNEIRPLCQTFCLNEIWNCMGWLLVM